MIKRKVERKDRIIQFYRFKSIKSFRKRYIFTGRRAGRFHIYRTEERPTVRRKAIRKMADKKRALRQLKEVEGLALKKPLIKEVRAEIDKKLLIPYGQRFTRSPTKQDSFKMYKYWLKRKGLKDVGLINRIISVDKRVLKTGVRAYVTMWNKNGNYIGMFSVYGLLPHKINRLLRPIKSINYEGWAIDSPGKLGEVMRMLNRELKRQNVISGLKYQINSGMGDYKLHRVEIRFDFA